MDLYNALLSGVSEKDLTEKFEQQLAEARMKIQAEKAKENNKNREREAAVKALAKYVSTVLGDIPTAEMEEFFNKAFLLMEKEIEEDMAEEKASTPINKDAEILKAFLKTL